MWIFSFFFLLLLANIVVCQESMNLNKLGEYKYGGNVACGYIDKNGHKYAMVSSGPRLHIVNVDDITKPVEASQLLFLDRIQKIVVYNGMVYIAAFSDGIHVIDVNNGSNPTVVASYSQNMYAEGVIVEDRYAYISNGGYGLTVLDLSGPGIITRIADMPVPNNWVMDVAKVGSNVYLTMQDTLFVAIDVSNPAIPRRLRSFDTPGGWSYGMVSQGKYLYIADGEHGMLIVNVGDPLYPVVVGQYSFGSTWASHVAVSGNHAYLSDQREYHVVNIDNPQAPVVEWNGRYYNKTRWGEFRQSIVVNGVAYAAYYYKGLSILDVSNPASSVFETGFLTIDVASTDMKVVDGKAYVTKMFNGMEIYDIAVPSSINRIAQYAPLGRNDVPYYGSSVAINNKVAFMSAGSYYRGGLKAVDISKPAQPKELGEAMMGSYSFYGNKIAVSETSPYAIMSASDQYVYVFNISDPAHPARVSSVYLKGDIWNIRVYARTAFIANGSNGILSMDFSNPGQPSLNSLFSDVGVVHDIVIEGNRVYIASRDSGIIGYNISDKDNPKRIFKIPDVADPVRLAKHHNLLFVMNALTLLDVYDISNEASPIKVGFYRNVGTPWWMNCNVEVDSRNIYVLQGELGITILNYTGPVGIMENKDAPNYALSQNYPNPFSTSTTLSYSLFTSGQVTLTIHDLLGREVMRLVSGEVKTPGTHQVSVSAAKLTPGVYSYRLSTNEKTLTRMMIVTK